MKWKLKRLRQCDKCPWKVSTDPHDIPHGYSVSLHEGLAKTIAEPGAIRLSDCDVAMSCHEHDVGDEAHCVGWLVHQLGPGNNIGLRLRMLNCENASLIQIDGEQHETFEDTLPQYATAQGEQL